MIHDKAVKLLVPEYLYEILRRKDVSNKLKLHSIQRYTVTQENVHVKEILKFIAKNGYFDFSITFKDLPNVFSDAITDEIFFDTLIYK